MSHSIFVTGGTGLLGRAVVQTLARDGHEVLLLARQKNLRVTEAWLKDLERNEPGIRAQIFLLPGDLTASDLGLSTQHQQRVEADASLIFHAGASTSRDPFAPSPDETNVHGTNRVLDLAERCSSLEGLVHVSDIAVAGDYDGRFSGDDLQRGQAFPSLYAGSKANAEELVRQRTSDLPATVLRLPNLVGHSQTGEIDKVDGLCHLLLLLVRLAMLPAPLRILPMPSFARRLSVDMLPWDHAAQICINVLLSGTQRACTVQVVSPAELSAKDLIKTLCRRLKIFPLSAPVLTFASPFRGTGRRAVLAEQFLHLPPDFLRRVAHSAELEATPTESFSEGPLPDLNDYLPALLDYAERKLL